MEIKSDFDTTIIRARDCKTQIIVLPDSESEALYSLFHADSTKHQNHPKFISSCHVFHGQSGSMDITNLAAGIYSITVAADCAGGSFIFHLK